MKNLKFLFLAAVLCGFALSSNAQSDTYDYETFWWFPTMCEGEWYPVSGMVYGKRVDHYNPKTGELEWYKFTVKGDDLTWTKNDEVFTVNFYHKWDFDPAAQVRTYRFNLRGDQDSYILVTKILLWDSDVGDWIKIRNTAKCL